MSVDYYDDIFRYVICMYINKYIIIYIYKCYWVYFKKCLLKILNKLRVIFKLVLQTKEEGITI